MKIRFYLGICVALFIGLFFATGVIQAGKYSFKLTQNKAVAIFENTDELEAQTTSDLSLSNSKLEVIEIISELEAQEDKDFLKLYHLYPDPKPFPELYSQAYLVADLDTGQLIKYKNRDEKYSVASITKLITALVSFETLNQDEIATVSYGAVNTYGEQGGLRSGQRLSVGDLLYPLLLESSNDAAEALAEHAGRSLFIGNMNGKVKSIGLENTFFADPSGLSSENVSTVEDLFKLVQYLYKNDPKILEITQLRDYRDSKNSWTNFSVFRNDENYLGGKNGYNDDALYTLISTFELPLAQDENRRIAIILLKGNEETEEDTRDVIYWLLKNVYYE